MGTTQPIKEMEQINQLKEYYAIQKPNLRNYAMICLGINSALRISDLLKLKWNQVYDFQREQYKKHIVITEQKTQKVNRLALNKAAASALELYRQSLTDDCREKYIFRGRYGSDVPLSRSQAFRVIKNAADNLHFEEGISCHSLRKTFGYHAWMQGVHPAILTEIYNHSSYQVTRRYLGITQDDKDDVFWRINL